MFDDVMLRALPLAFKLETPVMRAP